MYSLGCKNPKQVKDYEHEHKLLPIQVQKDVLEVEFEDEQDVNLLLTHDLMVRRRNMMVLPKIRGVAVEEMLR